MTDKVIESIYGHDEDVKEYLPFFHSHLKDAIEVMNSLIEEKGWEQLKTRAHRLKGSAGTYGFPQIHEAAEIIESEIEGTKNPAVIHKQLELLTHYHSCIKVES